MIDYHGGQAVSKGYYLKRSTWEFDFVAKGGGILPGNRETHYSRVSLPVVVVGSPLIGLAFIIFLPLIGILGAAGFLGYSYAKAGRIEKAREILAELIETSKERYVRPSAISLIYFGLGDIKKAFDWLEKGFEEHDPAMPWIRHIVPEEDRIRTHPRYKALLKKMGFEK